MQNGKQLIGGQLMHFYKWMDTLILSDLHVIANISHLIRFHLQPFESFGEYYIEFIYKCCRGDTFAITGLQGPKLF